MYTYERDKIALYKIALWMQEECGYEPPRHAIPENYLTEYFKSVARDYRQIFDHTSKLIEQIPGHSSGDLDLAISMLHFLGRKDGSENAGLAKKLLEQMLQKNLVGSRLG